jgi:hypothetical protein
LIRRAAIISLLALALTSGARAGGSAASVEAFFTARSYVPGAQARLVVLGATPVRAQLFRAGPEPQQTWVHDVMNGVPVAKPFQVTRRTTTLQLGQLAGGVYFVRLVRGSGIGYAPFIVRPQRIGEHRIAVVLPTNTWAAYNLRNGGSWYANARLDNVELTRPFEHRGVPPHWVDYDVGFVRSLVHTHREVDYLSDEDLTRIQSGGALARAYDLVVFSGHEEYVTTHMYDIVQRYRDLGGNLMFLAANNFFYRVERRGDRLYRTGRWRDLGRPEARLIGIQYLDWNHGTFPNAPYVVGNMSAEPWFFEGTSLREGRRFGRYGIEIDARTAASPPGVHVLMRVPNVFGPGRSAEMTYYETAAGAKVFAAGTIGFGGSAEWKPVPKLLDNLWARLAQP